MSFHCEHCYYKNTEVRSAGEIQENGAKYMLNMDHVADMERQVVKSDTAKFRVENLDIEIPPGRGRLTNIEGILSGVLADLEHDQKRRKKEEPELWEKVDKVVQCLIKVMIGGGLPCSISLDDSAGNSWIEPSPKDTALKYTRIEYPRSLQQNIELGLASDTAEGLDEAHSTPTAGESLTITTPATLSDVNRDVMQGVDILEGQMYSLPCHCPGCAKNAMMNIQMVNIPYFKQVIVSAVICDHCGYRTNDVKTGGEVPKKGQRILLDVKNPTDLRRDILKSESCYLKIPACRVEVVPGTMGGRFTTVEGLLTQIRNDLRGSIFDVDDRNGLGGDSVPEDRKQGWNDFFAILDKAIRGELEYTIELEDPLASSYVQSLTAPAIDPQIKVEEYERTIEEEEDLGLTDMRTELDAQGKYIKEAKDHDEPRIEDVAIPNPTISEPLDATSE